MSKVISFATQKGGAGKTTLLMLTAAALHNRSDKKILVMDSDPQLSVKTIYKRENNPKSYDVFAFNWNQPSPAPNFEKVVVMARQKYDVIFMDLPGSVRSEEFYYSVLESDILMVPIVASMLDLNATVNFLEMIPDFISKKRDPKLEVFGVINKRDKTVEHLLIQKLVGLGGMDLFYSTISSLVRYKRHLSTVHDLVDPSADDEFNHYFEEFRKNCFV